MDQDSNFSPANPPDERDPPGHHTISVQAARAAHERRRKTLLRKLGTLLVAAAAAFALSTWLLVRLDVPTSGQNGDTGPANVVRAQLTALDRGELREAYDLFSQQYRDRVSFSAFHELVAGHPAMFRARQVEFASREESKVRAVLDTHIVAADGERYLARYTLIVIEGHWWIDDLHWTRESESRGRITA